LCLVTIRSAVSPVKRKGFIILFSTTCFDCKGRHHVEHKNKYVYVYVYACVCVLNRDIETLNLVPLCGYTNKGRRIFGNRIYVIIFVGF